MAPKTFSKRTLGIIPATALASLLALNIEGNSTVLASKKPSKAAAEMSAALDSSSGISQTRARSTRASEEEGKIEYTSIKVPTVSSLSALYLASKDSSGKDQTSLILKAIESASEAQAQAIKACLLAESLGSGSV